MRALTSIRSWSAEQRVHQLLDACGVQEGGAFDEAAFLSQVGRLAGGTVTVARLPDERWDPLQVAMHGHVSGIAAPYPGGWVILMPETPVAQESTVVGHEAAHIIYGDTPHWRDCSEETRTSILRGLSGDAIDPDEVLPRSALRMRTNSRREAQAERFGALLTARLEGAATRGPDESDRLNRFFQVGEL